MDLLAPFFDRSRLALLLRVQAGARWICVSRCEAWIADAVIATSLGLEFEAPL